MYLRTTPSKCYSLQRDTTLVRLPGAHIKMPVACYRNEKMTREYVHEFIVCGRLGAEGDPAVMYQMLKAICMQR